MRNTIDRRAQGGVGIKGFIHQVDYIIRLEG